MPVIQIDYDLNNNFIFILRIGAGLIWFGTVLRRLLTPNFSNFEDRISAMSQGTTIFPRFIMDFAVANWFLLFLVVVSIEIIATVSLILGLLARGGALLATINGFAIGMAGLGLGLIDLLIPWSAAAITLFLFLFTHPGKYLGIDERLQDKNIPKWLQFFT